VRDKPNNDIPEDGGRWIFKEVPECSAVDDILF
jgi:hypothetical protein